MRARAPLRFCLALLAVAAAAQAADTSSNSKKPIAYRWVDDSGVVHYGDNVPPQYANKDRSLLNGQGVEVGHLDGERSAEQTAADEHARAAAEAKKQHDHFLMTTYTSVKDIEALRDERLDQLNGQRVAAGQYLDSLRSRLASLESRALSFAPYSDTPGARRMPDDLAENLVRTVNELRVQNAAYTGKVAEATLLRAQFQADIERYRELHTIHTP
jgi:hypothetical protein